MVYGLWFMVYGSTELAFKHIINFYIKIKEYWCFKDNIKIALILCKFTKFIIPAKKDHNKNSKFTDCHYLIISRASMVAFPSLAVEK